MEEERKTSKLAIFSFVLTVVSFLILYITHFDVYFLGGRSYTGFMLGIFWPLFAAASIGFILAIISLVLIKKYNLKGKIYSIISIILFLIYIIFSIWFNTRPRAFY